MCMIPLMNGLLTFEKDEEVNFRVRCLNENNSYCDNTVLLTISVTAPNGTTVVNNQTMTFNETFFNYSLPTDDNGRYEVFIVSPNNVNTTSTFPYIVNPLGQESTTSRAILQFVILIILFFFFILSLIGSIKIPFKNYKNPDGVIIGVNEIKYLKIILIVVTYILLMFIFGISRRIAETYLLQEGLERVFNWMFWLMFSFMFPIIILSFVLIIIYAVDNKKIKKALRRGVPIR